MDNHVHLLLTPSTAGAVAKMMQRLGRNYVALFNGRHGRTGTLWEGRYKACLVDSEDYVLRCYRYIELNPVRARMTDDPATHRWSSCAANLGQRPQSGLQPHPCWLALGTDAEKRALAYRILLDEALDETTLTEIRDYLRQQRALGTTPLARWSRQKPGASRAPGPPIDRRNPQTMKSNPISEPDPVIAGSEWIARSARAKRGTPL
ncbi:transposase [Stenotrophomonas sp. YIM B06876]|uniref:transposase n=1 Tax=Stenotrophomonas sp. YIM B06876 TaxID=3060211 RepID=UPI0027396474|nr:transposase [Stenotrophomonas sp. YIM B06876]